MPEDLPMGIKSNRHHSCCCSCFNPRQSVIPIFFAAMLGSGRLSAAEVLTFCEDVQADLLGGTML